MSEYPEQDTHHEKEEPYEDATWALNKVEGVRCAHCGDRSLKDKNVCMQNGCPYDLMEKEE